jgi:hypothetical protein
LDGEVLLVIVVVDVYVAEGVNEGVVERVGVAVLPHPSTDSILGQLSELRLLREMNVLSLPGFVLTQRRLCNVREEGHSGCPVAPDLDVNGPSAPEAANANVLDVDA